ncbi:MAG: hypothetical protein Q8P57_03515 [Candidatus Pacearchaeota archaeon]|nr:hypothetical protein [Candidatus Pacearchaeota archaeon]
MAVLRNNEIVKMDEKAMNAKLKELRMELVKAQVAANKTNAKTKEIKRAISRIITFSTKKSKETRELKNK